MFLLVPCRKRPCLAKVALHLHQLMPSIGVCVCVCVCPSSLIAPARPVKKNILLSTKTPLKKIIDYNRKIPFLHLFVSLVKNVNLSV